MSVAPARGCGPRARRDTDTMNIAADTTLRDVWEELARTRADHVFLVHEDPDGRVESFTYGEFATRIVRAANLMRALGVEPGERVGVHLNNSLQQLECLFALAFVGAVNVPLHPRNTAAECAEVLGRVGARLVVSERGVRPASGYPTGVRELVARDPSHRDSYDAARDRQPDELVERVALSCDDPVGIVFTSGSTAQPKGVVLTHANLVFSGRFVHWQASMTPLDRILTTMPACHVNFELNALMPVLTAGATLIVVERYSARRFWQQVRHHEATVIQSMSTIVRTMLLQPVEAHERDHRVRENLYYLPIRDEEKERFEQRFGVGFLNSYGASETLVGVLTDPPTGERRWPSVGQVGPGYEARIAGPDGNTVNPGVHGEIQIWGVPGRTLMLAYYEAPEATAAAYTADGWFRTGDVGWVDEDGWFYFIDRLTHFIKRAGENVSPGEVEAVLAAHPLVAEAAVIGVPDEIHDEAVKAFVVPVPGAHLTVQEVHRHCAGRLARFKVPTQIEIVAVLPHTSTFKVAKRDLS